MGTGKKTMKVIGVEPHIITRLSHLLIGQPFYTEELGKDLL